MAARSGADGEEEGLRRALRLLQLSAEIWGQEDGGLDEPAGDRVDGVVAAVWDAKKAELDSRSLSYTARQRAHDALQDTFLSVLQALRNKPLAAVLSNFPDARALCNYWDRAFKPKLFGKHDAQSLNQVDPGPEGSSPLDAVPSKPIAPSRADAVRQYSLDELAVLHTLRKETHKVVVFGSRRIQGDLLSYVVKSLAGVNTEMLRHPKTIVCTLDSPPHAATVENIDGHDRLDRDFETFALFSPGMTVRMMTTALLGEVDFSVLFKPDGGSWSMGAVGGAVERGRRLVQSWLPGDDDQGNPPVRRPRKPRNPVEPRGENRATIPL